MKAEKKSHYPSTKFIILTNSSSISSSRKKYLMWIIIITAIFCLTVSYLYYKIFISPDYCSNDSSRSINNFTFGSSREPILKFFNPKSVLAGFRRKDEWEPNCEESQKKLESIPEIFTREFRGKNFENIYDYINLDILLHYEDIINRNTPITLRATFTEYQLKLSSVRSSGNFINFLKILKLNKFNFYVEYLKRQHLELKNFENVFALTDEFNRWYNYLNRLNQFLCDYEQQKIQSYFVNCTEENFEKFTEETQKRLLHFFYSFRVTDKKLQEINKVISECAKPVQIDFFNSTVVFYNRVLLLSAINKEIGLNTLALKSAYVFASRAIYLDENIELPGVDLVMISPKWIYLKKVEINLSGPDGKNKTHVDIEQPGEPGNPGGNAGDFLGIGDPQEKFLLITANGGKGGNGQNGAKGQNGINNTWPDPPVGKPPCIKKLNSFRNNYGQLINHYKIYNKAACGSPGTDGGVGGQGGVGGVITLINSSAITIKEGLNGTSGSGGKGGVGGAGSVNGCFYEVFDVDNEIIHPVTRVKCPPGNVLPSGESGKDDHNTQGQILPPAKQNINLYESFLLFLRIFGKDSAVLPVLETLIYNVPVTKNITFEYKLLKELDENELYEMFNEKLNRNIQEPFAVLNYLKCIVLGRMAILKESINYYEIDFNKYLRILRKNIEMTNEETRELQCLLYLKKKLETKLDPIKQSLERIKFKLTVHGTEFNYGKLHNNSSKNLEKKKNLCFMIKTVDILRLVLNETPKDKKNVEFNDLLKSCSVISETNTTATIKESSFFEIFKNISNKRDIKNYLEKLKDVLNDFELSDAEKNLRDELTDELERIIALYNFLLWERSINLFLKSLRDLKIERNGDEEVTFLRRELFEVMIAIQYNLAKDALRQIVYPPGNIEFFNKSVIDLSQMTSLQNDTQENDFCKNRQEAIFDKNSAVGEFYFWPNLKIESKLKMLFSGAEINLKSNLINRHVFDKNFVQFTTLKLEFECGQSESSCQKHLDKVLSNFKISIIHSGYSYYNSGGETLVLVSDKVSLEYSFRTRADGEPEVYSSLYRKCQNGEIKLSPFTTWTVRLLPLNEEGDFLQLSSFATLVDLRLTGKATFTSL